MRYFLEKRGKNAEIWLWPAAQEFFKFVVLTDGSCECYAAIGSCCITFFPAKADEVALNYKGGE